MRNLSAVGSGIYLDNAATTRVSESVIEEMMPYFGVEYGNPGSPHLLGRKSLGAITTARERVAALIGCDPDGIIFTSCGSEANTLGIIGMLNYMKENGRTRVISSLFEHKSVLHALDELERNSITVDRLIGNDGFINGDDIEKVIQSGVDPDTVGLVCIMSVNNESGIVNDVEGIASVCKKYGMIFMTDAVQSIGSVRMSAVANGIDMVSVSGHKIHAPKGVGCLYASKRCRSALCNIIYGGKQENGLRSGTENVPGIVGFGRASYDTFTGMDKNLDDLISMHLELEEKISTIDGSHINFNHLPRCPKTTSVRFDDVDAETLVMLLDKRGVYVSAGSACSSNESIPSYVLIGGGLSQKESMSTIRISISPDTTMRDVSIACEIIDETVSMLRSAKA